MTLASEAAQQRQNATMLGYSVDSAQLDVWPLNPNWNTSQERYAELCGDNCDHFRRQSALINPLFETITALECLARYRSSFGNHSDVVLVATYDELISERVADGPLLHIGFSEGPILTGGGDWVWGSTNNFSRHDLYANVSDHTLFGNWNVFGYRVDYCLSRQWDNSQACALGFSAPILSGKSEGCPTSVTGWLIVSSRMYCQFPEDRWYLRYRYLLFQARFETAVHFRRRSGFLS